MVVDAFDFLSLGFLDTTHLPDIARSWRLDCFNPEPDSEWLGRNPGTWRNIPERDSRTQTELGSEIDDDSGGLAEHMTRNINLFTFSLVKLGSLVKVS